MKVPSILELPLAARSSLSLPPPLLTVLGAIFIALGSWDPPAGAGGWLRRVVVVVQHQS